MFDFIKLNYTCTAKKTNKAKRIFKCIQKITLQINFYTTKSQFKNGQKI